MVQHLAGWGPRLARAWAKLHAAVCAAVCAAALALPLHAVAQQAVQATPADATPADATPADASHSNGAPAPQTARLQPTEAELSASLGTSWYGLYMFGVKCGWARTTLEVRGAGPSRTWRQISEFRIKMAVMGKSVDARFSDELVFDGDAPWLLRRGASHHISGSKSTRVRVTRTGPQAYTATIEDAGGRRQQRLTGHDYTLADLLGSEIWLRRGVQAGATISLSSFSLSDVEFDTETLVVRAVKQSQVRGVDTTYFEVEQRSSREEHPDLLRLGRDGRLISAQLGEALEMRAEPKADAQQLQAGQDVYVLGMAPLAGTLGRASTTLTSLVLRARGDGAQYLPDGPRQSLARRDGELVLSIGAAHGVAVAVPERDRLEQLRATVKYPAQHQRVVALAASVVGDAATDREKVARLVAFVDQYVKDALGYDALSVFEVLDSRKGDCSEHALLLVTLARASGIAAREVGGLYYMGDDSQAFGAHAWCEVLLDGQWVPVDPTYGQVEVDAAHISMGSDDSGRMIHILGRVQFEVMAVNGRPPPVQPPKGRSGR